MRQLLMFIGVVALFKAGITSSARAQKFNDFLTGEWELVSFIAEGEEQ